MSKTKTKTTKRTKTGANLPGLPFVAIGSNGMSPTVRVRDRVLASKLGLDRLRRGDVISFLSPTLTDEEGRPRTYIGRVIAFAGERVECRDGGVFVNGKRLTDGVFARLRYDVPDRAPIFRAAEGDPFTVAPESIFVMGDNSKQSYDSRFYGGVPKANITGRVTRRWFPLSRFGPVE